MDETRNDQADTAAIAEAAVWVARLQSDRRPLELESEFRTWLAADPRHEQAFEAASDTWDLSGGVRVAPAEVSDSSSWRVGRHLATAAAILLLLSVGVWTMQPVQPIETAIGEQRSLRLPDGSMVTLNTATQLRTRFSDAQRLVYLDHGEASFEVARDTQRPFIVEAGGTRIVAIGTVFDVRWTGGRLAVTLAEGRVRVIERPANSTASSEIELEPGQRLVQASSIEPPRLAAVDLEAVRAWRAGQVVFANTPLLHAAIEMNRYSDQPLQVSGPRATTLRISGSFRAGDNPRFARALAELYDLRVVEEPERVSVSDPL